MTGAGRRRPAPRAVAYALGFAAVLALAAWVRLSSAAEVLVAGEVVPVDGDSAYHLARMLRTAEDFPRVQRVDPDMAWPDGGRCPWADGFDVLGAAMARAVSEPARPAAAALFPAMLGLLVVAATIELVRRLAPAGALGLGAALAAGAIAAVLPQGVASSRFGRTDHHVLEALSMLVLALWSLRGLEGPDRARPWRHEAAGALASALAVWGFAGGTLYVALAAAVRMGGALAERRPRLVGSGAPALGLGAALVLGLGVPGLREGGVSLSFTEPSLLQPLLLLAGAAGIAAAVAAARSRERLAARAGVLVAAIAAVALLALLVPGAWREIAAGLERFLLKQDPWLARIAEFQPITAARGAAGAVESVRFYLGVPGLLAPALVAVGAAWAARAARGPGTAFGFLALALLAMTLLQVRFGRVFAPFLAAAAGLALGALAERAARRWPRLGPVAPALPLALAVAALALDPSLRPPISRKPAAAPVAIVAAALDLAGLPRGPAPGVLARWDFGHVLQVVGRHPVVANGFGPWLDRAAFDDAERWPTLEPGALDALLAERRVGYLVAGLAAFPVAAGGPSPFRMEGGAAVLDRRWFRASPLAPVLIAGSAMPPDVPHLEHLLPRFASEQTAPGLSFPLPILWTYERVPGARLHGTGPPGSAVVATVALRERGRAHAWRAVATVAGDGRWALTVPVPTAFATRTIETGEAYEVRAGGGPAARVLVPERDVRAGAEIAVGALRPPP